MGIFRSGERRLTIIDTPKAIQLGQVWTHRGASGTTLSYIVSERLSGTKFLIKKESENGHEWIHASFEENRASVSQIESFGQNGPASGVCLRFVSNEHFTVAIGASKDLVVRARSLERLSPVAPSSR
jgi:hypothetical protein